MTQLAPDTDDDYNPCGEEYDHDLNLIGEDAEYRTYECRTCGADACDSLGRRFESCRGRPLRGRHTCRSSRRELAASDGPLMGHIRTLTSPAWRLS